MRLFIAATFPEGELQEIDERIAKVRARLPSASWVRPETQHLTFAFLGEQPEALVDALAPRVESEAGAVPRFEATLTGSGFFPNPRHPRVAWVGVEPAGKFREVAAAVRRAVTAAGLQAESREFLPHLTVCRIRDRWPPACAETFHGALRGYESRPFVVEALTLFSSQLHPHGAIHTPLRTFRLA